MSRPKLLFLAAFGALLLTACTTNPPKTPTPSLGHVDWTTKDVVGLTIALVDPVHVEWMSFGRDGYVPITIGRKHGYLTAPVFYWRIVSGRLRITDDNHKLYDELTLISRSATRIIARNRFGTVVTYKIQ